MTQKPMPSEARRGRRSMVEIALAIVAAWLLVSIALLRWNGHLPWL